MPSWYFKDTSTKQPKLASSFVSSTVSEEVVSSHSKSANAKNCVSDNPDQLIASPCFFPILRHFQIVLVRANLRFRRVFRFKKKKLSLHMYSFSYFLFNRQHS